MIENFEEDIIEELGLGDLPEEKKLEAVSRIGKRIQQSVVLRVIEKLSDNEKREFSELLTNTTEQKEILKFLSEKISNMEEIVSEEIEKFKEDKLDSII